MKNKDKGVFDKNNFVIGELNNFDFIKSRFKYNISCTGKRKKLDFVFNKINMGNIYDVTIKYQLL